MPVIRQKAKIFSRSHPQNRFCDFNDASFVELIQNQYPGSVQKCLLLLEVLDKKLSISQFEFGVFEIVHFIAVFRKALS